MPQPLLPSTAAPSGGHNKRSSPPLNVDRKIPNWLRPTLSRLYPGQGSGKRSQWTDQDYFTHLIKLLSSKTAIWTLCSFSPESVFSKNNRPSMEALKAIEVKAFIASVDTKTDNQVIFKLTYETIQLLIDLHRDHFSVNMGPSARNLLNDFTQEADRFVHRANFTVLKQLNIEGGGTFSSKEAEIVEKEIIGLFSHILLDRIDPSAVLENYHTEEQCGPIASSEPATDFSHPDFNYGAYSHSQDAAEPDFPLQIAHPVYGLYRVLPYPSFIAESPNIPSSGDAFGPNFWHFGG